MAKEPLVMEGIVTPVEDNPDPDLNAAFFEFMSQVDQEQNSGGTISVFRVPTDLRGNPLARTAGKTKLFSTPVGAATLDDICQRAVNDYMEDNEFKMFIQVMATRDGQSGIRFNRTIGLERPRKRQDVIPANNSGNMSAREVLELVDKRVAQQEARTEQLLRELMAARAVPAVNPMGQLKELAEVLGALSGRAAPVTPQQDMAAQMMGMMGMMKMMREFFGKDSEKDSSKESGSDFGTIIAGIKEIAAPMMQAHLEDKRVMVAREQRLLVRDRLAAAEAVHNPPKEPAPENTESSAPDTDKETETMSDGKIRLLTELGTHMHLIVDAAKREADPKQVCALLMQAIPESDVDMNAALFDLVMSSTWFEEISALNDEVKDHRQWFDALRDAILLEADVGEAPGPTAQ